MRMKRHTNKFDRIIADLPESKTEIRITGKTKHAFVTGDSLEMLYLIPDKSIDLIITDPPYNRGMQYGLTSDRRRPHEYYKWCKEWLSECARVLKNSGSFYLISYPENNARLLEYIEDELLLIFRRWITWHYPTNIGHSKKNFTRSQRSIMFFTKSDEYIFHKSYILQPYKNPNVSKIKKRIREGKKGRGSYDLLRFMDLYELSNGADVLEVNLLKNTANDRFTGLHPCQLPLGLLKIFVNVSSKKESNLLDPFAGTFTLSAVAAELERNSIGIDSNPAYIKLGFRRFNNE